MHNVDDLILNIDEAYKDCDERLIKNYRAEFMDYSPTKLEQIWEVIQENHNYAKAPELGNIFKYMNLVGIARTKESGIFYHRCTNLIESKDQYGNIEKDVDGDIIMVECGTKYSSRSKFCPKCNFHRGYYEVESVKIEKPIFNSLEIVKCNKLPGDLTVLNELCSICKKYHKNSSVRGSKCNAWGTHDPYKKIGKKCGVEFPKTEQEKKDRCPCYDCCNDRPMNGSRRETFNIRKMNSKGA